MNMWARLAILFAFLLLFLPSGPAATSAQAATSVIDPFDGPLDSRWSWVNENASAWSLTARPGFLRMMTHTGGPTDQNVLLQDLPGSDYFVETYVEFTPTTNFQWAGLVVYADADNYLIFGRAYCSAAPPTCLGNAVYFDSIVAGTTVAYHASPVAVPDKVFLRVHRRGNAYSGYYSLDGSNWTLAGVHVRSDAHLLTRGGLAAAQGLPAIPADFDYFESSSISARTFLPFLKR